MLKSALLCSAVCTAFVIGGRSTAALPGAPTQPDAPAEVDLPVNIHKVLRPLIGNKCGFRSTGAKWRLTFRKADKREMTFKLVSVGPEFVRVSDQGGSVYAHLSSVYVCTD